MAIEEAVQTLLNSCGYAAPHTCTRLGGLTNKSYRAIGNSYDLVVRLPGEGTEELVDRAAEKAINEEASRIGVDTPVHYFDPATGCKVSEWVPNAETLHVETAHEPASMAAIGKLLAKLHREAQGGFAVFDPIEKLFDYEKLIAKDGGALWADYEEVKAHVIGSVEQLPKRERVLCHCDPLCENFVKDTMCGRMYLVDWEYAGMNDPLWDVADVAIEAGYDDGERRAFESAYFGREPSPEEDECVIVNMVLVDLLWSLWGEQRKPYDSSLADYGTERFERAKANLAKL